MKHIVIKIEPNSSKDVVGKDLFYHFPIYFPFLIFPLTNYVALMFHLRTIASTNFIDTKLIVEDEVIGCH